MTQCNRSVQKRAPSKSQVSALLPTCIVRATKAAGGKGALADIMDTSTKTLDRALTQESIPEFHTVMAAVLADPAALDEVFALYGIRASLLKAEAANDMSLVAELSTTLSEFLRRLSDGVRCHNDTAVLAELFRHVIPQMQSIVDEHDARVAA